MDNIRDVMLLLGYQETSDPADANVIWCWRYPFTASRDSAGTPPGLHTAYKLIKTGVGLHQFVNQLPGIGSITTKSELGKLAGVLKFIPQTYRLPQEYDVWQEAISTAKEQGSTLEWIQKDPEHRGISVVADAQSTHLANRTQGILVQELVRPYLIGNRLWDFGVYVGITQLEPLMVYIYTGSVLLRFCKVDYVWNITDDTDPASYVIYGLENVHRSGKEVPEMEAHYKDSGTDSSLSSTMSLAAISSYLASQGINTTAWWLDVQSQIVQLLQHTAPNMAQGLRSNYPGSRVNFFTLLRFDFMFDHHRQNRLIEVNMSPGLHRHDLPRSEQLLSRKLVHDLVTLKGLAPGGYHHVATGQDLAAIKYHTDGTALGESSCAGGCDTVADCSSKPECILCRACRSQWQNDMLTRVMAEHLNAHGYMRIHPPGIALASYMGANNVDVDSYFDPHVRSDDAVVRAWLEQKCASDYRWC